MSGFPASNSRGVQDVYGLAVRLNEAVSIGVFPPKFYIPKTLPEDEGRR